MSIAKPTLATVTMTSANTEYSYKFPAGTRKFRIKLRVLNALFRIYGFSSGGSDYITVPYGEGMEVEAKVGGATIYFQSPKASQTAEIITWR